jgi:hypothetical protein
MIPKLFAARSTSNNGSGTGCIVESPGSPKVTTQVSTTCIRCHRPRNLAFPCFCIPVTFQHSRPESCPIPILGRKVLQSCHEVRVPPFPETREQPHLLTFGISRLFNFHQCTICQSNGLVQLTIVYVSEITCWNPR